MSKTLAKPGPDSGVRVLSLDGGGAGTLSELIILDRMMYRIRVEGHLDTDPFPCDCFELIGGSGTGGIIALMLGCLRMSVKDAISAYETLCPESKRGFAEKFKTTSFEEALKKIFKQEPINDVKSDACRTFVCAMNQHNMNTQIPHFFRSYNTPDELASTCMIWEAARATSATPELFKPIGIGWAGMTQHYINGGLGNNNPTSLVLNEARILFPSESIVLVCSIGSGHPDTIQIPNQKSDTIAKVMKKIANDCENTHENNARIFHRIPNTYFRFNVQQGMQVLEAKHWNKIPKVLAAVDAYLKTGDTKAKLTDTVKVILNPSSNFMAHRLHESFAFMTSNFSALSINGRTNNCPPASRIFQGRNAILDEMHQYFLQPTGKQHIYLLHGLGGAGKTQIALKFMEESASHFTHTFFIDTSTIETVDTGLKNIALAKSAGTTAQDTLQWLRNNTDEWLLFFDNADDPKLNLKKFLPRCNHGNILITSRNPELRGYAGAHHLVSDMEETDAVQLLLKSAAQDVTPENEQTAAEIVKALWYLPLAIIQAGEFILKSGALNTYLALYATNKEQLLREKPVQSHDDYAWTVYTTWQISFDQLGEQAATLLQLCSFLHREGISEQIFSDASAYEVKLYGPSEEELKMPLEFLPQFLGPTGVWDSLRFMDVITEIRAYSLINFDIMHQVFSIHPLVHAWIQSTLTDKDSYHCCMIAMLGMAISVTPWENMQLASLRLLPHVDALLSGNMHIAPGFQAEYGRLYYSAQRYRQAKTLQGLALERCRTILGADHPDTLNAMYELENTYRSLAKLTEAEQLQVAVVEKRKTVLGEDHPDTLTAMHDLASTYHVLGMLEEAEKLQVAVVEKRKNILGEDHPDTLIALNSLASTYYALGKFQEAEKLQVVALEKRRTGYPDPKEKKDLPATTDLPEYLDPKEKGNPGATTVSPEYIVSRWKEAALLLLPSHFSTPNLLTTSLPSNFLSNIAHFTVARSLEDSRSDSDYECVQIEVKEEWQRALTLLMGLAALETAAFAFAPGSIFPINKVARIAVSGSSVSTGAGLLFDFYLLLRFSLASPSVFKERTQDKFEVRQNGSIHRTKSYLFFAFVARLPLLFTAVSILFIAVLLVDVAYLVSPPVVLAILGLAVIILYLQYIWWALIWMVYGLSKVASWLVAGLSKAGTWPTSTFKYIVRKAREIWQ